MNSMSEQSSHKWSGFLFIIVVLFLFGYVFGADAAKRMNAEDRLKVTNVEGEHNACVK